MKSAALAALTLTLLAGACGDGDRTNCAIARERLDRCLTEAEVVGAAVRNQGVPLTIGSDCSDMNACAAACIKDASCEAIRLIVLGSTTDPNLVKPPDFAAFNLCLYACIQTYRQP
jgi:hypothetical protein